MLCVALFAAALAGCEREDREPRSTPVSENPPPAITMGSLYAGSPPRRAPQGPAYEKNAYHVSEGKRLFSWFNCVGCHAHGGGGSGPALIDDKWIYGGAIENIYATIVQGRPNGMPSFRDKIPEQQVWELAAYVRSLSGQLPKDVSSGRSDDMQPGPSEQRMPPSTPHPSSLPPSSTGTQ